MEAIISPPIPSEKRQQNEAFKNRQVLSGNYHIKKHSFFLQRKTFQMSLKTVSNKGDLKYKNLKRHVSQQCSSKIKKGFSTLRKHSFSHTHTTELCRSSCKKHGLIVLIREDEAVTCYMCRGLWLAERVLLVRMKRCMCRSLWLADRVITAD